MLKFIANDHSVMESIPKSEQASNINWNLASEPLLIERVFAVQWFVASGWTALASLSF